MKLLSIFAVCALLFACGNTDKIPTVKDSETVKAQLGDTTIDSDAITILGTSLEGNILSIEVEYSGGCEKHWFDLIGSFAIIKTLPAKRTVKLIHNASNDACRQLITQTLKFDVSALAITETSGSEIILLLEGQKGEISYVYP
jgi:hypothetical protein